MMKKIVSTILVIAFGTFAQAQLKTPQASPLQKTEQMVGLTNVEIEYSRPSAKGRAVFGDLVPYGKNWRTGANANTTISFSDDVMIAGKTLKKGKYALYTNPKADAWEIIFYTETNNWGLPATWDETKVALRTTAKPESLNRKVETFTIGFSQVETDYGMLELSWEKTIVPVKIEVPTQKTALKSIETVLAGPSSRDYFSAAQYMFQTSGETAKSLTWINKALEMEKEAPFWYLRLKSLILAKTGAKKEAVETAKLSLAAAEKANNADYVKMNKDSILEWSK